MKNVFWPSLPNWWTTGYLNPDLTLRCWCGAYQYCLKVSFSHSTAVFNTTVPSACEMNSAEITPFYILFFFSSSVKVISKFCYWSADTVCRSIVFTVHCINCNHFELSKISSDKITRGGQHDILLNSFSGGPAMLILAVLKSLPLRWLLLLQWWSITNG